MKSRQEPIIARILIVEDDLSLSKVLQEALTESGHHVLEAFDGISASKIVENEPLDLVITDIFLPEKDGLELIVELKKGAPDVRIIAISGGGKLDKDIYLKAAMTFGADHSIEKPFHMVELLSSIEKVLH